MYTQMIFSLDMVLIIGYLISNPAVAHHFFLFIYNVYCWEKAEVVLFKKQESKQKVLIISIF